MKLRLAVTLISDTCLSSGLARRTGDVDLDVEETPGAGLPVLRGRTLKGLLVEEAALILKAFKNRPDAQEWNDAAGRIFGVPGDLQGGSLRFGDGSLPSDVRQLIEADAAKKGGDRKWQPAQIRAALTTIRRQTKISQKTGGPERGSLRSSRLWRAGLTLDCLVTARNALDEREMALLAACAAAVRRIGAHRNRGWGRVRVRIEDEMGADLTSAWLNGLLGDHPAAPAEKERAAGTALPSIPQNSSPVALTFKLRLTAPVTMAMQGPEASTVDSLDYIPGSAILGAAAGRFLARWPVKDPASADTIEGAWFRRLFLSGAVRWLHAYPEGSKNTRMLPLPASFVKPKYPAKKQPEVWMDLVNPDAEPDSDYQPAGACFAELTADDDEARGGLQHARPEFLARLHHQRDRECGKPAEGGIFSMISLAPGQNFIGHALCEDLDSARLIRDLLGEAPLTLGRSKGASYGGQAEPEFLPEMPKVRWQEAPAADSGDSIVITLLSDYLGRDSRGRTGPQALLEELPLALGLPPDTKPAASFLKSRIARGYVNVWRMPRPDHTAVAAGSALIYEGGAVSDERLNSLRWRGLGERRTEGFGRVAVNWHGVHSEWKAGKAVATAPDVGKPADESPAARQFKSNLLFRTLRIHLARKAAEFAKAPAPPPASLLARLRMAARRAASASEIETFVERTKSKKAGESLARSRIGNESLYEWILKLCAADEKGTPGWWKMLDAAAAQEKLGIPAEALGEEDRFRLLQLFLDRFCEKLRRRAAREREERR